MWQITPQHRELAKDGAHAILFFVAVVMLVIGGILTSPADLGLIGAAMGVLAVIGIARA